jgi:hypothetical protein
MSLGEERAGRNAALFREVNEQGRALAERFAEQEDVPAFICECSNDECVERLRVPIDVYESVRAHPRRFLVAPGHEGEFEQVSEVGDGYLIVEKTGVAGRIAEQNDPRA